MLIGYALCGSFCTHAESLRELELLSRKYETVPILSEVAYGTDTRFGKAAELRERLEEITKNRIISTVSEAEPLGPKRPLDLLIIAPCTGNTLAKLALGITDTTVTMAAKAHLRCDRPLLISLASNDALSANLANLGAMLKRRSVYLVPMKQDDPVGKPHSLVADFTKIPEAAEAALEGRQLRPLFL